MNGIKLLSVIIAGIALACAVSEPEVEIVEEHDSRPMASTSEPEDPPPASCEPAAPPERQRAASTTSDRESLPPLYLAWSLISLQTTDGFDLDGACTEAPGCAQSEQACRSRGEPLPDDDRCRDNGFAHLVGLIEPSESPLPSRGWNPALLRCALWRGSASIVMRISDYDGSADDPQVRVDYYHSDGLESVPAYQCTGDTDLSDYPRWRRARAWSVDRSSLASELETEGELPDSRMFSARAYVEDRQLIAAWPEDTDLRFSGPSGLSLRMRDGLLRARIVVERDGSSSLRDGVFAGRVRARDVLVSLRQSGVCEDDERYGLVARFLDERLDVLASGGHEPDRDCDALSVGFGFEADAITPGKVTTIAAPSECAPRDRCGDGVWSGDESCDPAVAGEVGACPTSCPPSDDPCAPQRVDGSECSARCVAAPMPWAGAADGCCPPGTRSSADPDCAALCGNGKLDPPERCDTGIADGRPGACPTTCSPTDACRPQVPMGAGCERMCVETPVTSPGAADGCCPLGADSTNDPDCAPHCGNSVIEVGETCDPPSSCRPCSSTNPCLPVATIGSAAACNLRCEVNIVTQCRAGDRCCPQSCDAANDEDCSSSCGNRVIDPGETCESNTNMPCPESCDDGVSCTIDRRTGSAANCNLSCESSPIVALVSGDGCCPPRANANVDSDCGPHCGNRVIESGEQCDDGNTETGDGCAACRTESLEQTCLDAIGSSDACAECSCRSCPSETLACYSGDESEVRCLAVVACSARENCTGAACYCGDAFFCMEPTGVCRNEVEAAAGSTTPVDVSERGSDPNSPLGRAFNLVACHVEHCASECR